jgi:hypothetical protein
MVYQPAQKTVALEDNFSQLVAFAGEVGNRGGGERRGASTGRGGKELTRGTLTKKTPRRFSVDFSIRAMR